MDSVLNRSLVRVLLEATSRHSVSIHRVYRISCYIRNPSAQRTVIALVSVSSDGSVDGVLQRKRDTEGERDRESVRRA